MTDDDGRPAEPVISNTPENDREWLYLESMKRIDRELRSAKDELHVLRQKVRKLEQGRAADRQAIRSIGKRIHKLRLDRQLLALPRWTLRRVRGRIESHAGVVSEGQGQAGSLILVAPKYPAAGDTYGGQPVQRRVRYYVDAGFRVCVLVPSSRERSDERSSDVRIVETDLKSLSRLIESEGATHLGVHHPTPETWESVKPLVETIPTFLWIHGYEARDWRTLEFNYSADEIEEHASRLDAITISRQLAIAEILQDDRVSKIFVSRFMQGVAERFAGNRATNATVIHNVIDTETFSYQRKDVDQRGRILIVRSFAARNYATDLVTEVILRLSESEYFSKFQFTIRGDGKFFESDTGPLRRFGNVSIEKGFVSASQLAELHAGHGVMLLPTRWDSQGMTMGEAMSSGLVVVTNEVAAIPEFADDSSAILLPAEDSKGMAEAIVRIYQDPGRFADLSAAAAKRSAQQCGPDATIAKELELLARSVSA